MSPVLESCLRDAANRTFEQVVFLLPSVSPRKPLVSELGRAMASVTFSGPADGLLQLWVPEGFLPQLTSNMLGGARDFDRRLQLDALGELANIICGAMLPSIVPDTSFQQSPPAVRSDGLEAHVPADLPAASVHLCFDDSSAEVVLYLFERAA
jgi:chemotaxis protein CheY-P-specific phosphatase CheC